MGGTNSVNGSGKSFQVPNLWNKPNPQNVKTEQVPSTPIKLTSDNVKREELGFINPYNNADSTIAEAREIALSTNVIMSQLGYPNFKVTPKAVTSVSETVNGQTIPALNIADDNAVAARVANPKGPFAELFT